VNILHWLDNRTLIAIQVLSVATFGFALLALHRYDRSIRGAGTLAAAFLLGAPGLILLALRGVIPDFYSIIVSNACTYVGYLLTYRGIRQYLRAPGYLPLVYTVTAIFFGAHVYYSTLDKRIVPRIILSASYIALCRLLTSATLFRNAEGLPHRILFACSLVVLGLISASRALLTALHGAPQNFMQRNAVQTSTLVSGIVYIFIEGTFSFMLVSFAITSRLSRRAQQDTLTGVYTRRAIEEKLCEELARGARTGTPTAVLLLDVDHLKTINDTLGHNSGDEALKKVASTVSAVLRPFDHLGRYGGDEFLLILPDIGIENAFIVADRFRKALSQLPTAPTLSIGIAQSDPGESTPSLLARADTALYQAKSAGRDCIRFLHSGGDAIPVRITPVPR
jgi:diguanylate cyclase (GGDEF)-like protein